MIEIPQHEIIDQFPSEEGQVNLYYGLIRSGKTYAATADIHEEIAQGHVVYATWPIKLEDTDDRKSVLFLLRGLFLPWKKRFFYIPASKNFHYVDPRTGTVDGIPTFSPNDSKAYIDYLNSLNHCSLYIDEAWRIMAHQIVGTKNIQETYDLILVTGHKFKTVNLIAQRTITIMPAARSQVGRFYKCEKLGYFFGIPRFMRLEFQVMKGDDVVDDDAENFPPLSIKTYWGSKKVFNSYNSWFYGDQKPLHEATYWAYELTLWERVYSMYQVMRGWFGQGDFSHLIARIPAPEAHARPQGEKIVPEDDRRIVVAKRDDHTRHPRVTRAIHLPVHVFN